MERADTATVVVALIDALLSESDVVDDGMAEMLEYVDHLMAHDPIHPSLPTALRCVASEFLSEGSSGDDTSGETENDASSCDMALPFLLEALRVERLLLAGVLADAAEDEEAMEIVASARRLDLVVTLSAAGECFLALSLPERAAECFDEVEAIGTREFEGMVLLAASECNCGGEGAAIMSPSEIAIIFASAAYNGGRAYYDMGDLEAASAFFDMSADLARRVARLPIDNNDSSAKVVVEEGGDDEEDSAESQCQRDEREAKVERLARCGTILHNTAQYKQEISIRGGGGYHPPATGGVPSPSSRSRRPPSPSAVSSLCPSSLCPSPPSENEEGDKNEEAANTKADDERGGRKSTDDVLDCFRAALTARRTSLGCDHPLVADTLNEMSSRLYAAGREAEAAEGVWECIRIASLAKGASNKGVDSGRKTFLMTMDKNIAPTMEKEEKKS